EVSQKTDGLMVSTKTETIVVYDTATQKRLHEFRGPVDRIFYQVKLAGDGKTLFAIEQTANRDKQWLLSWDIGSGKLLHRVPLPVAFPFPRLEPLPAGQAVLLADHNGDRIYLVDASKGKEILSFEDPDLCDAGLAVSADGKMFVAGCRGKIQEWEIGSGKA